MGTRGRRRIRSAEYWRAYYTQKQREWRATHPRARNTAKTKNSGAFHLVSKRPKSSKLASST
jgi:hypothetical protein